MTFPKRYQRPVAISVLCVLLAIVVVGILIPDRQSNTPERTVQESWDLMGEVGQYDFSTTVEQTTYPAAALANVGQSSTKEFYQLSGKADLHTDTLNISLFQNQGSLLNQGDGVEILIEGDQAFGRVFGTSEWESLDDYNAASFNIGSNGSPFLASARNVVLSGQKTVNIAQGEGVTTSTNVTIYQFDVDPDKYAIIMRDQMVAELQRSGELPIGMELLVSEQYRQMMSSGEVWVNQDGLPLRLIVTMKMPPEENGDHIEATVTTDYFNHHTDNLLAAKPWPVQMAGVLGLPTTGHEFRDLLLPFSMFVGSILLLILLLTFSKTKVVYVAVSFVVMFSMLYSPIWQSEKSAAFAKDLSEKNKAIEANQQAAQADRESEVSVWNAHANPLDKINTSAAMDSAAILDKQVSPLVFGSILNEIIKSPLQSESEETDVDTDGDGLTDAYESEFDVTILNPNEPDTDFDGLKDNVELKLNLFPGKADSDNDLIWDNDEIRPFYAGDADWYLNPEERDTDGDGQIDSAECPERMERVDGISTGICRDTDLDGIPDAFDTDDDQDGVPTIYDESPYVVSSLVYSVTNPFKLTVSNLNPQPVFINYQVVPTNRKHLTYALNVLDWPSNDADGQVQRISATTFADQLTEEQSTTDQRSQFGDMRLIPMLEIELTGNTYPFPLSRTVAVDVSSEEYTGSFEFASSAEVPGNTNITLTEGPISARTLYLGSGTCDELVSLSALSLAAVGDSQTVSYPLGELVGGDYLLYLADSAGGVPTSCSPIPVIAHGKMTEFVLDSTTLQAYGGALRNDVDDDVLMYVPLSVVYDQTGGEPVAFSAKVPYSNLQNGFADSEQEVSMIWMINMLTDECKAIPASYDETASGTWCDPTIPARWNTDISRVVHTYSEDYKLTGLSVIEDHGVNMAVAFENPLTDTEKDYDDPLWGLSMGLEHSFLSGRSTDGTSLDITVDEIQHRFDPDHNDDITNMDLLWSFETDTFRVEKYSYADYDGVSAFIGSQATELFDTYFNTIAEGDRPESTTLLFAREITQRATSVGEPASSCVTEGCNLDFSGLDVYTQAMINWAPYQRTLDDWQPYDINTYLDNLESHLKALASYQPEDDSEDARYSVEGQISLAKIYYRNLYSGVAELVSINGTPVINQAVVIEDSDFVNDFNFLNGKAQIIAKVVSTVTGMILDGLKQNPQLLSAIIFGTKTDLAESVFIAFGKGAAQKASPITKLLTTNLRKVALGIGIAVVVSAFAVLAILYLNGDDSPVGKWAGRVLFAAISVVSAVLAGASVASAIKAIKSVSDNAKAAAIVGAIIGIIIAWGVFFYTWGASGVAFGSIAMNNMLADAIAATCSIVLLAALTCTGVGAVVVAIIGLIDAAIAAICALAGAKEQEPDHWARQYVCIGISGWITKIYKWILYSNTYLVDYENGDRLEFGGVDQTLQNVYAGMAYGNNMKITMQVTNTITKSDIPIDWKAAVYFWQFSDSNAKTSTFNYMLQTAETDIHDDLERGSMSSGWVSVSDDSWKHDFVASTDGFSIPVSEAGINRDPTIYFSEGSALPVQECWAIYFPLITPVPIPVCYIRTAKATVNSEISSSLTVDVFPANLDGFYSLVMDTTTSSGAKLSWSNNATVTFPVLKDADGDGLMSAAFTGGNDPDDTQYDTDSDGLNDFYELANSTNPRLVDSDDDGLNDNLEILHQTSPTRKDTDGDGLTDYEEVIGWLFTYDFTSIGAPMETVVYPDPLMPDSDLDGLTDYLERVYGFNPNVSQNSDVLDYELSMREQDAPIVMLRFNDEVNSTVFSDSSNFGFSGSCNVEECPLSGVDGRYAAAARFDGTDLVRLPTTAKTISFANNQPFTFAGWVNTSIGGTVLSKWSDAAGGQQEIRLEVTSDRHLQLVSGSLISVTSTATVPADQWTYIAASFDGSHVTFSIDGSNAETYSFDNSPTFADGSVPVEMMLGAYESGTGPTGNFNGVMDEIAVFDLAVSTEEIAERMMTARYNFNDTFVRPGEKVVYKSVITNLLNSRFAYGLLNTIIDKTNAIVDWATKLLPRTFVLYPDNPVVTGVNTAVMETELQIEPAHPVSEDVTITQIATAQIVDRRTESNRAELWLKLDETSAASTFVDDSGTMPPRDVTCTDCPASFQTGILNKAVLFMGSQSNAIPLYDLSTLNLLNRGYTLSMWVKPMSTTVSGARITLLKSDSNRLSINLVRQSSGEFLPEVLVNNENMVDTSWRKMKAGVWSHLVVRFSSADYKVNIYINGGQIADTSADLLTGNANLWLGGDTALTGFYVDDLRIFSRPLTMTDINRLAERPVLALNMDNSTFTDSSVYSQEVDAPYTWPTVSQNSVRGTSLNPNSGFSKGFIRVNGNSMLDMSDGSFTFSTWIYPTAQSNPTWQGIFGYHETSSESTAYPTLERQGLKLRFGFGDGAVYQFHQSADILTQNKWNYVMVTFAPSLLTAGEYTFRLYIDSNLKESKTFSTKPTSSSMFYVGTTSKSFTTQLFRLNMDNEHDAGSQAEVYIEENGSSIWSNDSMEDGDSYTWDPPYSQTFTEAFSSVNYTVWEEDSTTDDDNCGSFNRYWYSLPDADVQNLNLSGGFDGSLTYQMTRPSIEFSGLIDELQVYRYALDSEQAYDQYYAIPVTARLSLDDRPSSTYFENSAVIGQIDDGICTGLNCPAAGTIGLINQAVQFDGEDDVITVPVTTTNNYMVSLWVNSTCEDCGVYSLQYGELNYHQLYLQNGNICSLVGTTEMCTQGGTVTDGQWHYVVYSNNGSSADLWLDGSMVNTLSGSGAVSSPGSQVLLGYAASAGNPTLNGQLDDVRVFRYVQEAAVIAEIKKRAPILLGHLDEADGSEIFDDSTPNDYQFTCTAEACPTGGMEGRLRQSVDFNQPEDVLELSQTNLSATATAFTASVWIYPTLDKNTAQSIFTINEGTNAQPRYAVAIKPDSMYLTVQNDQNIAVDLIPQSNVELIKNTWNMVTLVVERTASNNGDNYSLYINGYLDSSWTSTTFRTGLGKVTLGNSAGFGGLQAGPYTGKLDEVTIFEYALNEIDIREVFAYQMGQVEESSALTVTIDAEDPEVSLVSYDPEFVYMSENDRVLHVEATDLTSGIAMVEMQVNHVDAPATEWTVAPVCQDAPGGTAFCPTFIPAYGEGVYTLSFRAVDQVGHQTSTPDYEFLVDSKEPKIFVNLQNDFIYNAEPHPKKKATWFLSMQGQVFDDTLSQVLPGSGLDLNSMRVTIYSENGEVVGAGEQAPELTPATNGYDWQLNYLFPEKEPTGALTVVIEVLDRVGNKATKTINILLDVSSANARMDSHEIPVGDAASLLDLSTLDNKLISGGTVSGSVNDEPADDIPYMTPNGKLAVSGVARVEAGFEPALGASYLFNEPYPDGLLAWLPLDNAKPPEDANGVPDENAPERYFLDISPYQFAGECTGANCPINSETGHKIGSIYFDGNEKYINLGQNVDLANRSFSTIIWARRDSAAHSDPILWQGPLSMASQRFLFGLDYDDHIVCGFGGTDLLTAEQYPDTEWHAYACTYDQANGTRTIYRDGQAAASDTAAPVPVMQENLFVGAAPVGSFAGNLDELMILDHALTAEEIREAYTAYQTVYHLTVEETFIAAGEVVTDDSGYFQNGTLVTGEDDLNNKVVPGQVGNYALSFDGTDRLAVASNFSLLLERGAFTQSAWIKPSTGGGDIISEYDENPEQRYPSIYLTANYGLRAGFGTFYNWNEFATADAVVQPDVWNHVTARFDGATYSLFVDGALVAQSDTLAGMTPYPADRFNIGDGFVGDIDDVKIFVRALSNEEILAMAHSGWRDTNLADSNTTWSAPVQTDMEGPYRVDVRAWDQFNHFDTDWIVNHQWSSVVDTLAPRLAIERTSDPDDPYLMHYSFSITDLYLDETSIHQNLCDEIQVTREYYNSSWHLSTGAPPNQSLYVLAGTCSGDIRTSHITGLYACDTAGNCVMQEYPPSYSNMIYLPMIASGDGANRPVAEPQDIPDLMEHVLQWATLTDSIGRVDDGQAPQVDITTSELTPADARTIFHTTLKGVVSDNSENLTVQVEVLQNGTLIYTTRASIYAGLWNAVWIYPPGSQPANGIYTLRVTAVDAAGLQTIVERDIFVHLLP